MRRLAFVAVLPLVLALASCGQDAATPSDAASAGEPAESSTTSTPSPTTTPSTSADDDPATTPELLDFTATTVTGDAFDGASLAGRPTVLWFWAPWCPTCRGQIPQVEALASDRGGDVNVIGVGSLDSAEAIAGFADDVPGLTHLEDVDGELWRRFEVTEQSSFVVLDADGTVTFEAGYGGSDDLDAEVESLLG
ncbi:Thiol-disulfide isomerase or thioredoxin [Nocardioides alpinus]|uniref:Thiol-disulfide isomerase or thioredoxin n=1 Tax=Nocardioides alpinus TaxID=748909 RepID=A0A1I0YU85_9ACTN|nr:redoxin domain-containing protein [Nocardioides alpinus]PKH43744.1 hypothetical protein CXG46_04660 [Nocardioides alpinus]SFB16772.1 Thiol-disulfide isomerase or thioredoxin [Nocardioides alpinus]